MLNNINEEGSAMDYKKLLEKYMGQVVANEDDDYIYMCEVSGKFTEKEIKEMSRISNESFSTTRKVNNNG